MELLDMLEVKGSEAIWHS